MSISSRSNRKANAATPAASNKPAQGVEAKPAAKKAGGAKKAGATQIKVALPTVDELTRASVGETAAKKLMDTVTELKDVKGEAEATNGEGDPRVTTRRNALSVLISEKSSKFATADALKAISPLVATDLAWLAASEKRDYAADGQNQFSWNKAGSSYGGAQYIQEEFSSRVKAGKTRATKLEAGGAFLDAKDSSVIPVAFLKTSEAKSSALADILLQFRGQTSLTNQREDTSKHRIDRVGVAMVAEQRVLLSSGQFSTTDPEQLKEMALTRLVIGAHPMASTTGIYEARNLVADLFRGGNSSLSWSSSTHATAYIKSETPPGATCSPYKAIHHNFSRDTPHNIRCFVNEWMFPLGDAEVRGPSFLRITEALKSARGGDLAAAQKHAADAVKLNPAVKDLVAALPTADAAGFADALAAALGKTATKPLGDKPETMLFNAAQLYRVVVDSAPTVDTLAQQLFRAGDAWPEVADVVAQMQAGNTLGTLKEMGEARLALQNAIVEAGSGWERHELMKFDATLGRLVTEELGASVDRVGELKTDGQLTEALVAMQTGLRSAVASGLHAIKDPKDPASELGESLADVLKDVDASIAKGSLNQNDYRELMSRAYVASSRTLQNIRSFMDGRKNAVAAGGTELDPMFMDQLAKEFPTHYIAALAQKGMTVGLEEKITPRSVENVTGMRVLNSIGPVVYSGVTFAENSKELARLGGNKDQLAVLYKLEEKKMVAVGGLFVDTENAPGGNSHLNMYAMNNGIPVVALPELRTKYGEFFANAEKEGGVYIDDHNGGFRMLTLQKAVEDGLLPGAKAGDAKSIADAAAKLRPGVNRKITYMDAAGGTIKHDAIINEQRQIREVLLYVPEDEVNGVGRGAPTFAELAKLGVKARHLAGEKGTVLALLSQHPVLGKHVPNGSQVTPGDIRDMMKAAVDPQTGKSLQESWDSVWSQDPVVGTVTDENLLSSAFYTDAAYRAQKREHLQEATKVGLTKLLVESDGNGGEKLTEAGQKLYDNLMRNPALAESGSWITRSSFTGEDRPGKSGAGQYESFPNLKNPVDRIKGVVGVIESAWMPEPVENNVAEQFNLRHIGPTVTVQHCLKPDISGVMISRNTETGGRNELTFQLVKGFGGGVEGGKTTEGVVSKNNVRVDVVNGQAGAASNVDVGGISVTDADMKKLREIVLETEKYFNEVIEPGQGHAVDMEVARENGEWKIVQARVLLMDK